METTKGRQSRWSSLTAIYCIRNEPDFGIQTQSQEEKKPHNALTKERIRNLTERLQKQQGLVCQKHHARHPDISIKVAPDLLCVLAEHADLEVIEMKWCS